ncbi:MAG: type II secretion system protein GspG [Phycisphaeraceae bacterium]|nr:type II secretion system protein GspG [Phycisphaeraceae bacterium]
MQTRSTTRACGVGRIGVSRARRAFSLLEITLVLAIIGVLMAVAAVNVIGGAERAKIRATKASMQTVVGQLKTYHLDNSKYPESLALLVTAKPAYLEKLPVDGWGNDFYFKVPGKNGRPYDLMSSGPDGEFSSEDDIDVWLIDQQ